MGRTDYREKIAMQGHAWYEVQVQHDGQTNGLAPNRELWLT
jgi:hypothetical protein